MNIVSIVAKTNTGELFDIPVSDLSKYTGTLSIGDGYLPKLSAGKFVASSVMEDKNGQIFFKNYKNDKSYIGTPVALLGYDINGGITPVPLVNRSQPVNTVTTSQSFVFNGTPLTIPIFSSDGSGLEDSDFKKFGNGNYSLGGTNPFFKFDVDKGSINISQQTSNDAFRINNKIVITVDQSNDEITIGNTIYHTANIQHIKTDSIQFNTSATGVTGGVGVLTWNDTDGTLEFGMKGGNVTQQIGQELPVLVKHADNSGLTNGSVVYIVGSDGNNKTVRLAKADSEVTSSNTFGIMTESATDGNKALCTTFGLVRDINTSSLTEGSAVYLSPSVAGGITSTKPTAPSHIVLIGFCVRSHSVNGSIFVNINNGYELDELHDVLIGTKVNKDLLSYESTSGLWKNKTFADLGLATVDAFWSISGNNIATTGIIGSITAQDVEFKANNQNRFTMYANAGLAIHSDTTFEDIVTLESSVNMSALTASQILALDASKNIQSLSTVTYPSLTELSYIKGLTSSAQTQINSKEPIISAGTVSQYWRGDKSWQTLDKSAVGLGNVDNTTDLLKPISTATQAALDLKANLAGPTFTGTVTLPSTTSIGSVSSTEIGYLDGVTSSIQSQINGKFDTPSGLTTNYLPKWNGTALVNSLAFDNGTNFSIGTNTNIDSYSRLYVFGGTNGANIDARSGGGGYDQAIFDAQGSDYATNFFSAHLRFQGIGAVGTTLGYSNVNLADLTYNYSGSDRAFLIRSVGQSPLVFSVNAAIQGKFDTNGLTLNTLSAESTDVDKFLVSNAGLVKYRTGTQILSDIGAFASPTGLTTNYVTKWNGTALVNSQIFDNGTNVGIGTYTNFGGGKVSVEHNSSFPNGLVVNAVGSSISPTLYLRNAIDGYKGRILFPYHGITFEDLSGINRLLINELGNIGIGTANPAYKLDVSGTGHFTGSVTFDTVPSSLQDATSSNHLVRYSQFIAATYLKPYNQDVKTVSFTSLTKSGLYAINGYTPTAGQYVLDVAGDVNSGIWVVASGAWTRATDADTDSELRGFVISISQGTYAGYKYYNTNNSAITMGSTAITYNVWSNISELDPIFTAWRDTSRTANTFWAAPNGSNGAATWRALVAADISNLNSYSSFSNYTSTTDLNTLLSGKSGTSHTHSFSSLTSIPTTVAGYGLTINTSDITGLSSYTGFSGYTTTTALNTLLSGYSTTSHTHAFSEITSTPTTLSGYGITDAQSVLNGTGYVKMSGTTLSYINKEFVDTTTDQTIYGQKIFRDSFKVGNSLFNIQTGQPDTVDNDLKFDFITDATSFNYSISDIDDNIGTLFSIQGNFAGTNIRTDISTDLYIYRIVDSNLSTGTNKQILRTDSSGILNWTTIDGSYISNWATKQDALNGTGFVKANGTTITYDNSTYLSTSVAATTYQPLDADLTSISALTGDGVLRKVSNVWNLDTDMYLTTDTKIYFIATATQVGLVNPGTTLTVNGLGNLNLKSGIVTTGTYRSVTVDTYGRVTAGTNPTTVVGYGLTDVWTKTESDARYLLQSSYNPTWGQLTGSPIDNTAFNSTMLGYVNTSTTQTGIAGSKTFTSAMYANGTLTTNQLFVKDTTGGNAYPLSIVNALTYNGWSGSSLIKSGLDIYNDYKPLVFLGSHFMMLRGSLKLGGNSVGATGTVDFATERLDITGNIRYSGTLKPSNIAPSVGQFLKAGSTTTNEWATLTTSDISGLSSYTGFTNYTTNDGLAALVDSIIPNGTSGHFLTRDSGGDLTFMNIDIDPVTLSANKIAVGSPQGILTEVTGFEFIDKRYLSITRKDYADQKITIGHGTNSQHALFDVQGGRMELNSNIGIRFNNLAGADTRMMVVNASGDISTQAIPTGGSGSNYLPYRRVPYGSAENTQTSDDSLRFYSSVLESELKLGISTPLSFRSDNTGYNNYIQSIGGYINMSSNRISLLVSASGQPNSGEIELSSYHNTLIHSGYGDVIINATEGDVIIKGGAVEWVTTTINGQTRQILCKKL